MRLNALTRTPYYVLTGGLAIIFLAPLIWAAGASVSPSAGTHQLNGYGLGNYETLYAYGAGLPTHLLNSVIVSTVTVAAVLAVSLLGGYAFAKFHFKGRALMFVTVNLGLQLQHSFELGGVVHADLPRDHLLQRAGLAA